MRIAVCSDIHLEFGPISLENTDNADVLVLSGDICVAYDLHEYNESAWESKYDKSHYFHKFFQECCERFSHVLYTAGNHEHYHGDFATTYGILRDRLGYLDNLHILDKQVFVLDDVIFVGGTLWTDMNEGDKNTMHTCERRMNDYRGVLNSDAEPVHYNSPVYARNSDGSIDFSKVIETQFHVRTASFTAEDSVNDHNKMLEAIDDVADLYKDHKIVVIGHHAPSKKSTKPQYENDWLLNGAYSSDLNDFIMERPQIKLWTHGHTHHEFDYMIGSTRIFCNPRGYINYEGQADTFTLKTVEI